MKKITHKDEGLELLQPEEDPAPPDPKLLRRTAEILHAQGVDIRKISWHTGISVFDLNDLFRRKT